MIKLFIEELSKACNGVLLQKGREDEAIGISIDTRTVEANMLFIAIKGENFDGHDFITDAYEKKVAGIIVEKNHNANYSQLKDIYIIEVLDTVEAIKAISRYYKNMFPIPFIGVTGSTGKTTTKDMISSVLAYKKEVLKNIGNFNNQIGLPLTLFRLEAKHEIAVLEMGMSSFGEIQELVEIVQPQVAVITNIGMSHIEHLGSKENILKAKLEIASQMTANDYLLLNGDDDYLAKLKSGENNYKKIFFGLKGDNDIIAKNIVNFGEDGFTFDVMVNDSIQSYSIKYPGIHNVYNALAAIWIGMHFNMTPMEIQEAFNFFEPTKMRMEMIVLNGLKIINDTYNASPDSMKAALEVLNNITSGRRIAILGNMFEMGSFAEEGHRSVGEYLETIDVEILLTVGDMARWIGEEVIEKNLKGKKIYLLNNNEEAISKLQEILEPNDVILVKGSRGMKMEEIVKYLQERS